MAVYNVQRGRSKVEGLTELQERVKALMNAAVKEEAAQVVQNAAVEAKMQVIASARAADVPHDVLQDIFDYGRQKGGMGRRDQITALVGMRKKGRNAVHGSTKNAAHAYRAWNADRQVGQYEKTSRARKTGGKLSIAGRKIGENLGTMWEFGTTKMAPRPWFRRAIQAARYGLLTAILEGYRGIIERHTK